LQTKRQTQAKRTILSLLPYSQHSNSPNNQSHQQSSFLYGDSTLLVVLLVLLNGCITHLLYILKKLN